MWTFCFVTALTIWLLAVFAALWLRLKKRGGRLLSPFHSLAAGTFLSAAILMLPISIQSFSNGATFSSILKTTLLTVYQAIQLFLFDGDFSQVQSALCGVNTQLSAWYSSFAAIVLILAPVLTLGVVLSFFRNICAYRRYIAAFHRDAYIFSALNRQTITLAEDLARNHDMCIVFAGTAQQSGAEQDVLLQEAEKLGAVCFKSDVLAIPLHLHGAKSHITFFLMQEDEEENLRHALGLIARCKTRENTVVYVLSCSMQGELALAGIDRGAVRVHRIHEAQAFVYRMLYDRGSDLFRHALPVRDGQRQIGAVIVGMHGYGLEMLKALTWYCQMDGYCVRIDAFDADPLARSRFTAACPELMDEKHNGVFTPGEAQYRITIHGGYDFDTIEFADAIRKLPETTYVFVCLDSDTRSIACAAALRTLFTRMGIHPVMQAVVCDSQKKQALQDARNFRGQPYAIEWVADAASLYRADVIVHWDLEQEALQRHLKWGSEAEFWAYEYNYRSSMASALHRRARIDCGIAGADKAETDLTEQERACIALLEHRRWNAYMRTEGYVYSGSPQKQSRNDLGKMHHDLVAFSQLSEAEKRKDGAVGSL